MTFTETVEDSLLASEQSQGPTARGLLWLWDGPAVEFTPLGSCFTLGRTGEADVELPSALISRLHARIGAGAETLTLEDLGSRNGTFVNGLRQRNCPLHHGDIVRVGTSLALVWDQPGDPPGRFAEIAPGLFGGPTLRRAVRHLATVARSTISVALVGPTGTGKEAMARALHLESGRTGELVAVNCATVPSQLAEAQLFGHKKGAFTGALTNEPGYFRIADGGTLFLDEIVELPLEVQAKLLRATQEDEFTPVGETRPIPAKVRIVVASQAPLGQAVATGRFRQDLAARLDGYEFRLPTLAERREDVPFLFRQFLEQTLGRPEPPISSKLIETLCLYSWPNNVRELVNTARHVALFSPQNTTLGEELLPERIRGHSRGEPGPSVLPRPSAPPSGERSSAPGLLDSRDQREWEALRAALAEEGGNVRAAAEKLGISRGRAYRLLAAQGESAAELRKELKP